MAKQKHTTGKDDRARNWTFLVYKDSAPEDWRAILRDDLKLFFVVSPYHQYDINEDGTPKKAHWHVVLCFEGLKSYDQIQAISNRCSGVLVQPVSSMQGMVQYLIHKNNPEKYQYDREEIESYGIDIDQYFALSSGQINKICKEMIDFINENDICEFSEFVTICNSTNNEWLYILMNRNTLFFKTFLYNRAMIKREGAGR